MSSKISIIIATYNQKKYLKEAIKSVLSQTYRDFELLIWDDGSTDGSIEIAKELTRNDKRVRVVEAPHQGVAMSRVAALAQTTGEYIGWVDSDDLLGLTALEETAAVLDQNPKVGMVYTDYVDIDSAGKIVGHGFRCNIPYSKDRLLVDFMTFHFRLIRRSIYEQVGGINPVCAYAYEYDLCLRISEVTEIFHLKKPLYFYRTHPNNISSTRAVDQILWSQWAIAEALKRRGLDDKIQVDVEMLQVSFVLRRKQPPDAEETPDTESSNHQKSNNTIQEISSTPRTIPPIPRANLKRFMCWGLFPLLLSIMNVGVGNAQQITPAKDGINTIVNSNGDRIDIIGGAVSRDGTNY
ncbi:MAG: glycosyltransferase [Calothrix sp. C42_A2020_038]|nr:glycosyltransferase [Calothrix sp. C42_A2020_038]